MLIRNSRHAVLAEARIADPDSLRVLSGTAERLTALDPVRAQASDPDDPACWLPDWLARLATTEGTDP